MPTISLRCSEDERTALDQRAARAGMTRTAFMLRAALDRATEDERRFAEIEARLARVETGVRAVSANGETPFPIRLGLTKSQLVAISKQAGVGPFDGRARSDWIVGVALGEPRDELLKRVRSIRDAERGRIRAERLQANCGSRRSSRGAAD